MIMSQMLLRGGNQLNSRQANYLVRQDGWNMYRNQILLFFSLSLFLSLHYCSHPDDVQSRHFCMYMMDRF